MPRFSGAYVFLALPLQNLITPLPHNHLRNRQINYTLTRKLMPLSKKLTLHNSQHRYTRIQQLKKLSTTPFTVDFLLPKPVHYRQSWPLL